MKLFFGTIEKDYAYLSEEESHHLHKVLRMRVGDKVSVTNGEGKLAQGSIQQICKKVTIRVENCILIPKPTKNLHIAIAPTKNIDRFEFFIEKSIELGVNEITPILTQNSERRNINSEKLQKQLLAASKQCLRSHFPTINPLTKLNDFIEKQNNYKIMYVCHCDDSFTRERIQNIKIETNNIFLIGPEGDFSKEEIQNISEMNAISSITLGESRLRTETAGIYIASFFYTHIIT